MIQLHQRSRDATLVVSDACWLLLPIPKVASTLLKRLAVIAAGRDPAALAVLGETRPALAIHRADLHRLPSLAQLPALEAEALLADPLVALEERVLEVQLVVPLVS